MDLVRFCAIDPGGTTGWSILDVPTRVLLNGELIDYSRHWCGHIDGDWCDQTDQILSLFEGDPRIVVTMESFSVRKLQVELSPLIIASMVEYAVWDQQLENPYLKQSPSDAMTTATDARLKRWGLWEVGKEHARDANRHNATTARKLQDDRALLLKYVPWIE